ncbi:pentatricopeptide repeat-containing protein At4g39952, mitochondrial-like [Magnolia sinica]|uniref:pentatricopeptide repeat-containing protein At4g39952, mitochondrial-like n=1 Tax=Magnolia sinica TaxID=86752 RepID=UPI002659A51A|nr:pentatricopeptide repeat-containing protein At4g39952, mitochondrial-like [Magnolia sinica]XP_058084128.1 pentatricopeptide repeat-containing protein At4g39952, mitochondrial-like [Magnolia sinica]XP_058084135.1 pentatricopeptide repeat-containing protein At4g39952, mitochondrial-like [Magnolia sinica]XP_058084144.1 pentatricopeptide repeat-containing protein At4g39952, mitochondrial-like [Magnolia sinica]
MLSSQNTKRILASSLQFSNLCHSSAKRSTHYILDLILSEPISTIQSLFQAHSLVITYGHSSNIFFAAKLISLYSSFNKPDFSTLIFNSIPLKDTFLWNSIIKSHFSNGSYGKSIEFYLRMCRSDAPPNHFTIPMVIAACAELPAIEVGRNVHGVSLKLNLFVGSPAVGSSFVYLYAKCGQMDNSCRVFEEMPVRDVVAWTALIIGCVQNDESVMGLNFLRDMHKDAEDGETKPNSRTMEGGLQACGNLVALSEGRCLHCYVVKTGIGTWRFVRSSLLSMYSKGGSVGEASLAFSELPDKDLISWTAIVGVHAKKGCIAECLGLFRTMEVSGIDPDGIVVSCLLMGFANFRSFSESKAFHGLIVKKNFKLDVSASNSLLSMYCKFECLDAAEKLFNRIHQKDSETWNCMIVGYGKMGLEAKCIEMFREMQFAGSESDSNSWITVISSCPQSVALCVGQSIHCHIIKSVIDEDVSVMNSLVGMYGRCGNLDLAQRIFYRMHRDTVTWNSLISAYTHSGRSSEALSLFNQMLLEDVEPNSATLVSALSACSNLAALNHGKWIHNYVKETGMEFDVSLATALVDMYAKCGQLEISREIFDAMPKRDVISWNVMIFGYGIHGNARDALETFQQMENSGMKPNEVTFLAVLSACSHAGLVVEGTKMFGRMIDYSITPTLKHYACMVDLLGRSGNVHKAEAMISTMPIAPDGGVWGALLSACSIHDEVEMGERIAKRALELDPENDGYYILISNMYSSVGRWEEAERVRRMMKRRGVRKRAGWSAMELGEEVHVFMVGDRSHPLSVEMYEMLEALSRQMEELGYAIESGFGVCHVE